jgi:signal transduction histidine kinase
MDVQAALQSFVAVLPFAAFVIRSDDRVSAWNDAAASLLGLPAAGALGRDFRDLAPSYRVAGLRGAVEAVKGGGGQRLDDVVVPAEDGDATVTFVAAPLPLASGDRAVIVVGQRRDEVRTVTAQLNATADELRSAMRQKAEANEELRIANEELSAANEQLNVQLRELEDTQEASRRKDDFLAMLAHELRNPLAPIFSATQIIRLRQEDRESVQHALEIIERQVHHQARLLDDLLEVSRVARGKIQLRRAPTTLADVVGSALETTRSRIEARDHAVRVSLPDAPIGIDADITRLGQAVANVLDNAAKYTPPGGCIEITGVREGQQAVLRIRDTGVGIPPEMLERIFELFTQVDASLARSQGGLGIGLTLARTLVEMHGGTLQAASDGRGHGSEFTVRIPSTEAEAPAESPRPAPAAGGRSILVIEDNADAREMLRVALELDGHRVEVAEDGSAGVETALRVRPDVALVDIGLPQLDGYEVARRLRGSLGRDVLLVALTGYGQAEDRRRTRDAGFDAHLVKPVDPDTLRRLLADAGSRAA